MPDAFSYPSAPSTFFVQRTPGKARLFIGELGSNSASLVPVTTVVVDSDSEVDQLVSALTGVAWFDDHRAWKSVAAKLPEAVVLACNQALAAMPPVESLALGSDGVPMTVLREMFSLAPGADDLASVMSGAYDVSLHALVDNYRNDDGDVCCRVRLLSGEAEVPREQVGSVWPVADSSVPSERRAFGPRDLEDILNDVRWTTHRTRAYWVWLLDGSPEDLESGNYEGEAVWVVEYFEQEVPDDPLPDKPEEWERFVKGDWNPWPMTARTRFVLWNSLIELQAMLEAGLEGWTEGDSAPEDHDFVQDYPLLVRSEPRHWWVSLLEACGRLAEAMRTGERWNPRTPAEEALIYIAGREGWVDTARELIDGRATLRRQFATLPEGKEDSLDDLDDDEADIGLDFDWPEVPCALAGDEDIALLWEAKMDGIDRPDDPVNRQQGIGDYRAASWHKPFDRYRRDPEAASALY